MSVGGATNPTSWPCDHRVAPAGLLSITPAWLLGAALGRTRGVRPGSLPPSSGGHPLFVFPQPWPLKLGFSSPYDGVCTRVRACGVPCMPPQRCMPGSPRLAMHALTQRKRRTPTNCTPRVLPLLSRTPSRQQADPCPPSSLLSLRHRTRLQRPGRTALALRSWGRCWRRRRPAATRTKRRRFSSSSCSPSRRKSKCRRILLGSPKPPTQEWTTPVAFGGYTLGFMLRNHSGWVLGVIWDAGVQGKRSSF